MILVAAINFIVTRYVLKALGVSDYGLYNVVGGIVTMMSFISIAMMSTTRRFVNVEMGKGDSGNVSKVFNICYSIHVFLALFLFIIALTVGLWYIFNFINVEQGKLSDAIFVFFISTSVSAITLVNVPFQALMTAYERFKQMAIIDFLTSCLKLPLVFLLLIYTGNHLRFYAIGVCAITLASLLLYHGYCKNHFNHIIKWRFYKDKKVYRDIVTYNNYTSLGAFSILGRNQGSTMIVNYFFGTMVNGAYAIAMQIDTQIFNLIGNIGAVSYPQMTQNYSAGNYERSFDIVCKITRFSSLLTIVLCVPVFNEITFLLQIWLHEIPQGAVIFCQAILVSLFVRSLVCGIDGLIQATGRLKAHQIVSSTLLILPLPLSIGGYMANLPAVSIIFFFILADILKMIGMLIIVTHVAVFDFNKFFIRVYIPLAKSFFICAFSMILYSHLVITSFVGHCVGFVLTTLMSATICFYVGMLPNERRKILMKLTRKIK